MRIVVDTNVVISGVFFGGNPLKVLKAVTSGVITACATPQIVDEYLGSTATLLERNQGKLNIDLLKFVISSLEMIEANASVKAGRDPDDDKFIECAIDAKALYIVSGDNDLLSLKKYKDIEIVTAKEFCEKYL